MNGFTKSELAIIHRAVMRDINQFDHILKTSASISMLELLDKLETMANDYWLPENVNLIGTGQLLFHNKESSTAIVPEIASQINLCENTDKTKCFRIDWKIIYGKKFGQ